MKLNLLERISGRRTVPAGACPPELEASMDGFLLVDSRGRLAAVNRAYCAMSGYAAEELLGLSLLRLESDEPPAPGAGPAPRPSWDLPFESRHRRKDGSCYDVEVSSRFLPGGRGSFAVFVKDISWRKRLERTLLGMRTRLAAAIAGTGLGTWDWDVASGAVRFCARSSELLGFAPEPRVITVEDWLSGLHPQDAPAAEELLWKCLGGGAGAFSFEARHRGAAGWVRLLTAARVAEAGPDGRPVLVTGAQRASARTPGSGGAFSLAGLPEVSEAPPAGWEKAGAGSAAAGEELPSGEKETR